MGDRGEMGGAIVSELRTHLQNTLADKVRAHGLVVWQDEAREYLDVAVSMCPAGVDFHAWHGSWYGLRREIEERLAAETPPNMVVYVPSPIPDSDPLAEVRETGMEFKLRLGTLVRQALAASLPEARLKQVAESAATLVEAETLLTHAGGGDIRLVRVFGVADGVQVAIKFMEATRDGAIDEAQSWPELRASLAAAFGGSFSETAEELRAELVRQLMLTQIRDATGDLPGPLASLHGAVSAPQKKQTAQLVQLIRSNPGASAEYLRLASGADEDLDLATELPWSGALEPCFASPAVDSVALTAAAQRLRDGACTEAAELGAARVESPWTTANPASRLLDERRESRWRLVIAAARLGQRVADSSPPRKASADALIDWYIERAWQVDAAHRRLELALTELTTLGDLEQPVADVRVAYDKWLDGVIRAFTSSLESGGPQACKAFPQTEVHSRFVAGQEAPVAYFVVDALRFELGHDLADALGGLDAEVGVHACLAALPTVTSLGMARLAPAAADGVAVSLNGEDLAVSIGGQPVATVKQREQLLRAAHPKVVSLDLNSAAQQGEAELSKTVAGADVILVRSQEIDAAGESGMLNTAWSQFETVKQLLVTVAARLGQCGVQRVVVAADHGFIALSRALTHGWVIDPPIGGQGVLHKRAWIGRGGVVDEATLRIPLAAFGVTSDLEAIVPRGLALFRAGGGRQFFHGGPSLQELVVPVIVATTHPAEERKSLKVEVAVAGGKISTGVFSATLTFSGDLFTSEFQVRAVARTGKPQNVVARAVAGDAYDVDTGTIKVSLERAAVLTFQVTANLAKGAEVELQVLDGRTGRKVGDATAVVAADVVVEDSLD